MQFWNEDKTTNTGLILEAISLLLGSKGAGVGFYDAALVHAKYEYMRLLQLREGYAFTRLLIEMALASNAPTTLKVKVLLELTCNTYGRLLIFL